eukprot:CAMPEP_0181122078 /NCGR_PEP_ID=MMETSP1071-20121207/25108_1 /TAXON_ID=35127 /ORGANISM="Thalassiosira sp., Strain NH16" /LENGTH=243 /DNA_ID=CAMNT_0023206997 /DNA_START=20 /DNA_END=751 /DNA_ORIENTATION=-
MDDHSVYSNGQQYGGDDDRSMGTNQSSIGMASSAKAHGDGNFMTNDQFNATNQGGAATSTTMATPVANGGHTIVEPTEGALTTEAKNAVSKERQMLYKENAAKLQSILENIKNSTKNILKEMDAYLQETEEVEKTFISCRANTQKESQRMEQVEPDVIAATQRFVAQGAQLFGGAGGSVDFMNMAALMGMNGSGGGPSMGMSSSVPGANNGGAASLMGTVTVTPRGNNDASSLAGSSMAGSMS